MALRGCIYIKFIRIPLEGNIRGRMLAGFALCLMFLVGLLTITLMMERRQETNVVIVVDSNRNEEGVIHDYMRDAVPSEARALTTLASYYPEPDVSNGSLNMVAKALSQTEPMTAKAHLGICPDCKKLALCYITPNGEVVATICIGLPTTIDKMSDAEVAEDAEDEDENGQNLTHELQRTLIKYEGDLDLKDPLTQDTF